MNSPFQNVQISTPLTLPCGAVLKNRIAKSAMSENLGNSLHQSDVRLERLYRRWANGGAGLLITGNVMVDSTALGEPNNVVFEKGRPQPHLKNWTQAGTENGTHLWVQLNHPGKQTPKFLTKEPVSPSAIGLRPPLDRFFNLPRALTESEIESVIERFGAAASMAKSAGFTGIQIHGAHGYLVSQFLSPLHNQRTDSWGGSFENRIRFAQRVYSAIREAVGPAFPVGIKLNSADFQRGGFTQEESMDIAQALSEQGMDLIEISGGTYETPEMTGVSRRGAARSSTLEREAYFLEYCEKIRGRVECPIMLTGGFRSLKGMESALSSEACDLIGLARSIALNPEFPNDLLIQKQTQSEVRFLSTGFKVLDRTFPLEVIWYSQQLRRMAEGKDPSPRLSVLGSVFKTLCSAGASSLRKVRA